ncbi:patatin-like phospholipase family protein [Litoreibacter roseus]|uniref:Lipoprotein n=1 Tax=Litoreibacter roseus TaxID=2601869 RepID=A0A6N6JK63_9RHOB|nr:patatin-like phospholipase family protein [Litoreibacter roseus]GFE66337.1 lipoprotein [Litoreibacter roseus]
MRSLWAMILAGVVAGCSSAPVADLQCPGLVSPLDGTAPLVSRGHDGDGDMIGQMMLRVLEGDMDARPPAAPDPAPGRVIDLNILAISTGGQYGSFASGFLAGWSKSGTRPDFSVVTGASAGGVIAPLAFAGPSFDDRLGLNAGIGEDDVVRRRSFLELLGGATALYRTEPFEALVSAAVDAPLIETIGARWEAENELLIGATNLSSGRFDILDVGKFSARSDLPMATREACVTSAVLATSAIPGLFPPRQINGALYTDAGIREHIFLEGIERGLAQGEALFNVDVRVTAYLLINSDLRVRPDAVEPKLVDIAERSFELVIDEGLRSSLLNSVTVAERAGWRLRAVKAPDYDTLGCPPDDEIFSACITRRLFEEGEKLALAQPVRWKGPAEVRAAAQEF